MTMNGAWHKEGNRRYRSGPMVKPGSYQVVLTVDGEEQTWLDRIRVWLASPLGSDAMQPAYALRGEEEEPQIFAADNGMQYYILEQERYDNSTPLKSAEVGANYLSKLEFA